MTKLWQRTMKGEKGQVLPGILILLALGTLLIAPALNYAATSLNAGRIAEENMRGGLAADAGVEHVLWSLIDSGSLPDPYPPLENVNGMQVEIGTEDRGTYTLYNGELQEVGEPPQIHYDDWLGVESEIVWVEPAGPYRCTITVTLNAQVTVHLSKLGIRLPPGYDYQEGSALWFWEIDDNLSKEDPQVDELDWTGEAHMLAWQWSESDRPTLTKDKTEAYKTFYQTFYVTVEGEPEEGEPVGYYAWVEADPDSVGQVGEFVGTLYGITATARSGDGEITEVTGRVTADVLLDDTTGKVYIFFWRTSPQ